MKREEPELEFKPIGDGELWIADCEHLGNDERWANIHLKMVIPVGEAAYVALCEKCAAAMELDILREWAGLKSSGKAMTTPEIPPYEVLREKLAVMAKQFLEQSESRNGGNT